MDIIERRDKIINELMENYVLSNKNTYHNFDEFTSGKSNMLFITGLIGGGKSTLAKKLCKEYNACNVEIDAIDYYVIDGYLDEQNEPLKAFIKDGYLEKERIRKMTYKESFFEFMDYVIDYCDKHKEKKFIINGFQIMYHLEGELLEKIKKYPIVIINTSMVKAKVRALKRKQKANIRNKINRIKYNFNQSVDDEKHLQNFKDNILIK